MWSREQRRGISRYVLWLGGALVACTGNSQPVTLASARLVVTKYCVTCHSPDGAANAWLVQGVANYVRHVAGYLPDNQRRAGGAYDDGGTTTGFFLVWLDQRYPDFVYELNLGLDPSDSITWTTQSFTDITGQSVDLLWANYQATL